MKFMRVHGDKLTKLLTGAAIFAVGASVVFVVSLIYRQHTLSYEKPPAVTDVQSELVSDNSHAQAAVADAVEQNPNQTSLNSNTPANNGHALELNSADLQDNNRQERVDKTESEPVAEGRRGVRQPDFKQLNTTLEKLDTL